MKVIGRTTNRITNARTITGTGATVIQTTIKVRRYARRVTRSTDRLEPSCHKGCVRDAKRVRKGKSVKRPTGVTAVAVLTFFGAAILALSSFAFFFVAVMAITGGDAEERVSIALTGMGVAGGFSLLVLAGVATSLAIGVLKLREWARIVSIASIGAGIAFATLSLFAFRRYVVIPIVPSIICHLLVLATAGCMVEYLSRPRVKQVFNMPTLNFH